MAPKAAVPVARFPTRFLTVAVVLTGLVLLWLAWGAYHSYQATKTTHKRDYRIEQLRGSILRLNEMLPLAARMAVMTGDPEGDWEERYHRHAKELDDAIQEAIDLGGPAYAEVVTSRTDEAHQKRTEMEQQAFNLVRRGELEAARSVLFSEEYESQEEVYSGGMERFARLLGETVSGTLRSELRQAYLGITSALVVIVALLVGWGVVLRTMRAWREALLANNLQLARQADELAQLNVELDKKVAELEREIAEWEMMPQVEGS